jgi:hypothetical protein
VPGRRLGDEGPHRPGGAYQEPYPRLGYRCAMCRSIKSLRRSEEPATDEEVRAAALQFVRKLSGYRAPSPRNTETFESAVDEIAAASRRMLDGLVTGGRVTHVHLHGAHLDGHG